MALQRNVLNMLPINTLAFFHNLVYQTNKYIMKYISDINQY